MLRIGLTGGVGSGKSTVAKEFVRHGAVLIDADAVAREIVEPGTEGLAELREAFGPQILRADGSLDRARLGEIVFRDSAARDRVNAITHPRVRARAAELEDAAAHAGVEVVVHDIPLLVETGQAADFDLVVVVEAPRIDRLARLAKARGWSAEHSEQRMMAQASDEERRSVADIVIENAGSREELARRVAKVWSGPVAAALRCRRDDGIADRV